MSFLRWYEAVNRQELYVDGLTRHRSHAFAHLLPQG